jgi:hypothetical protein
MAQAFVVPDSRRSHGAASTRSSLKAPFFTDDWLDRPFLKDSSETFRALSPA